MVFTMVPRIRFFFVARQGKERFLEFFITDPPRGAPSGTAIFTISGIRKGPIPLDI
jgi:hypothetical protein